MPSDNTKIASLFEHSTVAILGAATEARAVASFLASVPTKEVLLLDQKDAIPDYPEFTHLTKVTGPVYLDALKDADVIIRSPGVPFSLPALHKAIQRGAMVTSMTKIFFDLCPAKIIGVTGSNGKTTTVNLIAHLLSAQVSSTVWRGGNDADPLITRLGEIKKDDIIVLELSSFQLHDIHTSPHIAVITNITPNHLDYHATLEEYIQAKRQIVVHQKKADIAILNEADTVVRSIPTNGRRFMVNIETEDNCGWLEDWKVHIRWNNEVIEIETANIPFLTAAENLISAIAVAVIRGISKEDILRSIQTFTLPPQRLERVRELDGVTYRNDSSCTTPESTIFAIRSFPPGSVILIAGGKNKGMSFDELGREIVAHATRVMLIGESASDIEKAIRSVRPEYTVVRAQSLADAVQKARECSHTGDTVIFSPACASFDMFANSKERGKQFAEIVRALR